MELSFFQNAIFRQQSAPGLRVGRLGKSNDSGHQLNKQISNVGTVVEELEYANVAAKTLDMDEIDKESLHLLVFLFMQFLSHPEQARLPQADDSSKGSSSTGAMKNHPANRLIIKSFIKSPKITNYLIAYTYRCFQCLYSLLGYNELERRFQVMPNKIRSTPTVNAFLANLPQMLDYNFAMGETLLLNIILILQKLPFPPRYASSWQQSHTLMQESHIFQGCGFSLWYLEPNLRKNWLLAAVVIFYKYNFNVDTIIGDKAIGMIRIVLHTLAAHVHTCDRYSRIAYGAGGGGVPARSRDLSQLSIGSKGFEGDDVGGDDEDDDESPQTAGAEDEEADSEEEEEEEEQEEEEGPDPELQPIFEKSKSTESPQSPEKTTATIEATPSSVAAMSTPPFASAADVAAADSVDDVGAPMAGLFGFLPRPIQQQQAQTAVSAPTPDHHRLTAEGLPRGWTMQLMRNGRTLFIDNTSQITTWVDPRTGKPAPIKEGYGGSPQLTRQMPTFESPPSPLSLMDVITVGSPIAVDRSLRSNTSSSSVVTVMSPEEHLPQTERLLPIGGTRFIIMAFKLKCT